MSGWIKSAIHYLTPSNQRPIINARIRNPLKLEILEDRITPATSLAPPTLLNPATAIPVDQASYSILGNLQEPGKNGAAIQAFLDGNHNGIFDAGVDTL